MMYGMLCSQYKLRGWIGFPYALVNENHVERLSRDEFNALLLCDGQTDIEKIEQRQILDTLHSFEQKGIVRFCDDPEEIKRDQYYHHYDNRYIHDVYWSITGKCNFKCRHCYLNAPCAAMGEMSHEEALNVIDQIAECGVYHLELSGGEPFVRKDFWDLVDHIIQKGITIDQIYTNGYMLTDSMLDKFEERGIKPEFSVSFDGVDWHDWMRGVKGAEQATLNALRRCYLRGFPTSIEMCIHRGNADSIRETIDVLADSGVQSIKFSDVSNTDLWKQNADGNDMSTQEYIEAVMRYIPEFYEDGMPMNLLFGGVVSLYKNTTDYSLVAEFDDGTEKCLDRYVCGAVRSSCYIAPDGRLLPCMPIAAVPDQSIFPKIQEVGLRAALKDSLFMEFARKKVKDLIEVCETCRECPYHLRCGGGCRANAVMEGEKNLMGPDINRCIMWKEGYVQKVHDACDEAIRRYCKKNESA